MPTIISHAAVPLAIGLGLGRNSVPPRLLALGVVASILPDLDVLAFRLGIAYSDQLGHRGFSHSLLLAFAFAAIACLFSAPLRGSRPAIFGFLLIVGASHGLLDMFTNGGLGIAYLWPFSDQRFFFPDRPIQVSPLSIARLLSPSGLAVLKSELVWVWLPAFALFLVLILCRRRNAP